MDSYKSISCDKENVEYYKGIFSTCIMFCIDISYLCQKADGWKDFSAFGDFYNKHIHVDNFGLRI